MLWGKRFEHYEGLEWRFGLGGQGGLQEIGKPKGTLIRGPPPLGVALRLDQIQGRTSGNASRRAVQVPAPALQPHLSVRLNGSDEALVS